MARAKSRVVRRLTALAVRNFSRLFLVHKYDGSHAIPDIHMDWWDMCTSNHPRVAIAAPRNHAKSTAITFAFVLCSVVLRYSKYVFIVGCTEDDAIDFLTELSDEIRENDKLREMYGIKRFVACGKKNIEVEFEDGEQFRIRARGAGQPIRGKKWRKIRPDLIVIDDLETDEGVESDERRQKLLAWFNKAVLPSVSKENGRVRIVGTILHHDSLLMGLINSPGSWVSKIYKAHNSFDDFGGLIWPSRWTETDLREQRQVYIDSGDSEGYSQEYLNDPSDLQNPYFRLDDFIPMNELDHQRPKTYYVGVDFALSEKNSSDFTVMTVGGYDSEGNLHIVDLRKLRTSDASLLVDELFSILARWEPHYFLIEGGVIANAVMPMFEKAMRVKNKFANIQTYTPIGDKKLRATSIQSRMRIGGVRFDQNTEWYEGLRNEMTKFPKGAKDDQVDSMAWLGRGIHDFVEAPSEEEAYELDYQHERDIYEEDADDYDYQITGY